MSNIKNNTTALKKMNKSTTTRRLKLIEIARFKNQRNYWLPLLDTLTSNQLKVLMVLNEEKQPSVKDLAELAGIGRHTISSVLTSLRNLSLLSSRKLRSRSRYKENIYYIVDDNLKRCLTYVKIKDAIESDGLVDDDSLVVAI